jgi:hypothetical protein
LLTSPKRSKGGELTPSWQAVVKSLERKRNPALNLLLEILLNQRLRD